MKGKGLGWLMMLLMGVLALAGCLPEPLPVSDIPTLQTKIVVSSQIVPDQGLVVLLSKSIGALDAGADSDDEEILRQIVIDDAIVTLHHLERTDTLLNLGSGLYGGLALNWATGINYTLHVNAGSLGEVSAVAQVRARVPFQSATAKLYFTEYDSLAQIDYSLRDPAGRNFYMVNVQQFSATQDASSLLSPRVFTRLVEDETFNEQVFREEFKVFFRDFAPGDSIAVFMSNISEEYYQFLKLRNDNRYSFVDFASEPINYPTNVTGGYGFFNLHVPDVRFFVLE